MATEIIKRTGDGLTSPEKEVTWRGGRHSMAAGDIVEVRNPMLRKPWNVRVCSKRGATYTCKTYAADGSTLYTEQQISSGDDGVLTNVLVPPNGWLQVTVAGAGVGVTWDTQARGSDFGNFIDALTGTWGVFSP